MVNRRSKIILNKMKNINHRNTRNFNNLKKILPLYELLLNKKINDEINKIPNLNFGDRMKLLREKKKDAFSY